MSTPLAYTVRQAAAAVGLSDSVIYALIREHTLPCRWYGNGIKKTPLILAADLEKWLHSLPDEHEGQRS